MKKVGTGSRTFPVQFSSYGEIENLKYMYCKIDNRIPPFCHWNSAGILCMFKYEATARIKHWYTYFYLYIKLLVHLYTNVRNATMLRLFVCLCLFIYTYPSNWQLMKRHVCIKRRCKIVRLMTERPPIVHFEWNQVAFESRCHFDSFLSFLVCYYDSCQLSFWIFFSNT